MGKRKRKRKKRAELDRTETRRLTRMATIVGVGCSLILIARFVSSYFPQGRLWGLNHLAYFSLEFRLTITLLGLLLCLPVASRLLACVGRRLRGLGTRLKTSRDRNIIYFLASILFFFLFRRFGSATYLLGDGQLQVNEITKGIFAAKREFFTFFIHFHLYRGFNQLWHWDVATVYTLTGCISGAVFILLLFRFLDSLEASPPAKGLFFAMTVCMGSSQLFFGYLENYTLHYLGLFAYIFAAINWLRRGGSIILPVVLFLLSLSLHAQALCLLPSLVYLCLSAVGKTRSRVGRLLTVKIVLAGVFASVLLGIGIYFLKGGHVGGTILMPLFRAGSSDGYTLFSLRHLSDLLNEHILISTSGIILLFSLAISYWRRIDWSHSVTLFLLLVSIYFLLYNFALDPKLGMARDWDLFAASGIGYTLLGLFLVSRFIHSPRTLRYVGTVLVGTALVSLVPWLLINSNEARSLNRFKNLLALDPGRSAYGYEILSVFCRERGMADETIEALKNAIQSDPGNARYYTSWNCLSAEGIDGSSH